jgi:hypothetical protein
MMKLCIKDMIMTIDARKTLDDYMDLVKAIKYPPNVMDWYIIQFFLDHAFNKLGHSERWHLHHDEAMRLLDKILDKDKGTENRPLEENDE